jgi:hypothetical protein
MCGLLFSLGVCSVGVEDMLMVIIIKKFVNSSRFAFIGSLVLGSGGKGEGWNGVGFLFYFLAKIIYL